MASCPYRSTLLLPPPPPPLADPVCNAPICRYYLAFSPAYSRIFCLGPNPSYNFIIEGCQKNGSTTRTSHSHFCAACKCWTVTHVCFPGTVFSPFWSFSLKHDQKKYDQKRDYYSSQDDLKKMVHSNKCLIEFNLIRMQAVFSFRLQRDIYTTYYTLKRNITMLTQGFTACIWIVRSYLNSQGQNAPGSPPPCS